MRAASRADALVIHPRDNVAVALRDLAPGTEIRVHIGGVTRRLQVMETIPANHKVALRRIPSGGLVIKYGEPIGEATQSIPVGTHVHIQNVRSRRVRPREGQRKS
jgi:altronate dehydratase small subunit